MNAQLQSRNFGLDLVRAMAITMVLLAHHVAPLNRLGVYGVELFFVLSGYLIGGILYRQFSSEALVRSADLWLFWRRRWYRTLPLYYLFLVVVFVQAWVSSGTLKGISWNIFTYGLFLQNFAWPINNFSVVTWSLAIEEWFYLLFPLCICVVNRLGVGILKSFMLGISLFLVIPFVLRMLNSTPHWDTGMRMVVVFRLDALMYGLALAVWKPRSQWLWKHNRASAVLGIGIIAGTVPMIIWGMQPGGWKFMPALLFSLIPLGFGLLIPYFELLRRPFDIVAIPITRLSEWSYSIYLCHIPVLFGCYAVFHNGSLGSGGKIIVRAIALLLTFVTARMLYRYFESPIMRMRPVA
jgi:peptidoglycan/LPS O-acetylase OafA/YrhL